MKRPPAVLRSPHSGHEDPTRTARHVETCVLARRISSRSWASTYSTANPSSYLSLLPGGVEPVLTRRHNQRAGTIRINSIDLEQIIDRLFGEIFTRHNALAREHHRQILIHSIEVKQILRRLG